ncbi:MAG: hypothetical protein MJ176_02865 [Treponema sp.]|nr:hypothetical protein [Treponema sp.]
MTDLDRKEINDALYIVDQILPLLNEAKAQFRSARNWGFFDILGGGFITDLIKHSKLGNAANVMNRINYLLMDLQRELKDIRIPTGYNMNTATFATFADFVFDGALADIYMQSKIMSSLSQVEELEQRLLMLRQNLTSLR